MRWLWSAVLTGALIGVVAMTALIGTFDYAFLRPLRKATEEAKRHSERLNKSPEWREEMQKRIDSKD